MQPLAWHCEQLEKFAVPVQDGTWKICGGGGSSCAGALQQICPVQSLLCWQLLGHVAAQNPPQQSGVVAVPLQSDDWVHALGHGAEVGFRQRPCALRLVSRAATDVQQISPLAVLQPVSEVHAVGQSLAPVQMGVL